MKKIILLSLVALMVLGVAGYVYASGLISGGGPHDMTASANIAGGATGELCAFCHTPHNANANLAAPLSNRAEATIEDFCMSCHDGDAGVSAGIENQPRSAALTGGVLSGDAALDNLPHAIGGENHPVNIAWGAGSTNTLFAVGDAVNNINAGADLRKNVVQADIDPTTCTSCHDVHNNTAGTTPFLRIVNSASELCLACHNL